MYRYNRLFVLATLVTLAASGLNAAVTFDAGDGKSLSLGITFRTSYSSFEASAPDGDSRSNEFKLNSTRISFVAKATENVGFKISAACEGCIFGQSSLNPLGSGGRVSIPEGFLTVKLSDDVNIWAGRAYVPSARTDMDGPFSAISFLPFTMPAVPADGRGVAGWLGRDEGVVLWGNREKVGYAIGVYDGLNGAPNHEDSLLVAGRLTVDVLNKPPSSSFLSSSSYHGRHGNILTLGFAAQHQSNGAGVSAEPKDFYALMADAFIETVASNGGVFNVIGEYRMLSSGTTPLFRQDPTCHCLFEGDALVTTAAYMAANRWGRGVPQPYIRYQINNPEGNDFDDSSRFEVGLNWYVDGNRLKLQTLLANGDANKSGYPLPDQRTEFVVAFQLQI